MESFDAPQMALLAIEQGAVKAWTRYPAMPPYFYAVLGAAEGVLSILSPLGEIHWALALIAALGAAGSLGAVIGAYRKLRGQTPVRAMPHELRRPVFVAIAVFLLAYGVLIGLSFTSIWVANPLLGAAFAHVGGAFYERRYREAADQAERRVGLQ